MLIPLHELEVINIVWNSMVEVSVESSLHRLTASERPEPTTQKNLLFFSIWMLVSKCMNINCSFDSSWFFLCTD
jgi:hypothetical protein